MDLNNDNNKAGDICSNSLPQSGYSIFSEQTIIVHELGGLIGTISDGRPRPNEIGLLDHSKEGFA